MKISDIENLLDAEVLCGEDLLSTEVFSACCSDMMSDVLAYVKDQGVLLTGLVNPQVVRTAEMSGHGLRRVRSQQEAFRGNDRTRVRQRDRASCDETARFRGERSALFFRIGEKVICLT